MNRLALKAAAREQIKGKIGILFVINLIISILSGILGLVFKLIPFGGLVSSIIITPAFILSLLRVDLNIVVGNQPTVGDSLYGFDDFCSAFKVNFLSGLFTFLWSLLFIIPGIVKAYSYSMSLYILAEKKENRL